MGVWSLEFGVWSFELRGAGCRLRVTGCRMRGAGYVVQGSVINVFQLKIFQAGRLKQRGDGIWDLRFEI